MLLSIEGCLQWEFSLADAAYGDVSKESQIATTTTTQGGSDISLVEENSLQIFLLLSPQTQQLFMLSSNFQIRQCCFYYHVDKAIIKRKYSRKTCSCFSSFELDVVF